MAADDLPVLREELPEVFKDLDPPFDWEDHHVIPVDVESDSDLENDAFSDVFGDDRQTITLGDPAHVDPASAFRDSGLTRADDYVPFPGSPWRGEDGELPPPDALAVYFPFHFFYPDQWGIYLIIEGVQSLALYIRRTSGWNYDRNDWNLSQMKAWKAARRFLYHHEAFHHKVESMATRLEVTHRQPIYRRGFWNLYQSTLATPECMEEALANAYAYRKVKQVFKKKGWRWKAVERGLRMYMEGQPPGYNRAMEFVDDEAYYAAREAFAERSFQASLPITEKESELWRLFSYAFSGITQINSYTNYLISKDNPLLDRIDLHHRCISYRNLKDKLDALVGLTFKRDGKGSHEVYQTDNGDSITLYHTSGDVPKGTLNSILKQAGVDKNVYEFLRHRV